MPLHRRVPKRGFHNPFRVEYEVVNLDTLGQVRRRHRRTPGSAARARHRERGTRLVKVLARGEVGKALTVRAHKFSGKAAEKIAAAGGGPRRRSQEVKGRSSITPGWLKLWKA